MRISFCLFTFLVALATGHQTASAQTRLCDPPVVAPKYFKVYIHCPPGVDIMECVPALDHNDAIEKMENKYRQCDVTDIDDVIYPDEACSSPSSNGGVGCPQPTSRFLTLCKVRICVSYCDGCKDTVFRVGCSYSDAMQNALNAAAARGRTHCGVRKYSVMDVRGCCSEPSCAQTRRAARIQRRHVRRCR